MYKFQFPNSSIAIAPYVGINLRFNVWGEQKQEYKNLGHTYNLFDKDDMEDDDWNRFQIGWRTGVKGYFGNRFMVGAGYGYDFNDLYKKAKVGEWTLQLGYTF